MRYKIELDSEARGYYPFTLTGVILVVGIILLCANVNETQTSDLVNNIYWVAQIAAIIIDILSLKLVFPNEYLILIQQDTQLEMRYVQKKKIKLLHKVSTIEYYWTYNTSKKDSEYSETPTHFRKGGPGGHTIKQIVVLKSETGEVIYLIEQGQPWTSIPKWPYTAKSPDENATQFSCFELEEVVQALKTAGLVK